MKPELTDIVQRTRFAKSLEEIEGLFERYLCLGGASDLNLSIGANMSVLTGMQAQAGGYLTVEYFKRFEGTKAEAAISVIDKYARRDPALLDVVMFLAGTGFKPEEIVQVQDYIFEEGLMQIAVPVVEFRWRQALMLHSLELNLQAIAWPNAVGAPDEPVYTLEARAGDWKIEYSRWFHYEMVQDVVTRLVPHMEDPPEYWDAENQQGKRVEAEALHTLLMDDDLCYDTVGVEYQSQHEAWCCVDLFFQEGKLTQVMNDTEEHFAGFVGDSLASTVELVTGQRPEFQLASKSFYRPKELDALVRPYMQPEIKHYIRGFIAEAVARSQPKS